MKMLLRIGLLLYVCCASGGYTQGLGDDVKAKYDQWKSRCDREFSNPTLTLLRGKISRSTVEITDEMLKNGELPTESEQSALAIFYTATDRCNAASREIFWTSAETDARYAATLNNLLMLKEGRLTYGEYNRHEKQAMDTALNRIEKQLAEQKSAPSSSSFYLSCVLESPSKVRGLEFIYLVDPQNNTISATRGGAPESISIGAADIRFNFKGKDGVLSNVQISRLSGRYNLSSCTLFITGQCQQTNQRKF